MGGSTAGGKHAAALAYQQGQPPMEIFLKAGFSTKVIGRETPNKCLLRWKTSR
jgi:hypothetical protein